MIRQGLLALLLCMAGTQALADSVFTHAILSLPFEVKIDAPWSRVITSQEQWQQFYDENTSYITVTPAPPVAPQIDFSTYTVVVGGLSAKTHSHTSIVVDRASTSSNSPFLNIALLSPGSRCTVTAQFKYPSIAVLLPKFAGELQIYTLEYVHECPG